MLQNRGYSALNAWANSIPIEWHKDMYFLKTQVTEKRTLIFVLIIAQNVH